MKPKFTSLKSVFVILFFVFSQPAANAQTGANWTSQSQAIFNQWRSITYGNGLFVAVSNSGAGDRVMTSPDGINWTSRTSAANNSWNSVTYGNGLFVAVSTDGLGNRVMTSPDGLNWMIGTSAANNSWSSVTYGNGLFVAVANSGTGNRVMTSPDGISWTGRNSAADNTWSSVTYGNGLFVAVATSGTGNRVMTSPDGINWITQNSAADNNWVSVTFGNNLFVATASTGIGNRVMTSTNGISWVTQNSAADNIWQSVIYGNGIFVAVSTTGTGNRVMTSSDGITWFTQIPTPDNAWRSVTYANGIFVAVSNNSVSGPCVMTSGTFIVMPVTLSSFTGNKQNDKNHLQWKTENEINTKEFLLERSSDGRSFSSIATIAANGNSNNTYSYTDDKAKGEKNYYRLKMTDKDGRFKHSNIIVLSNDAASSISVYPNPVKDVTTLQVSDKVLIGTVATIADVNGRTVKQFTIKNNFENIDLSNLPQGIYMLKLANGSLSKLIKQ